MTQTRGRVRVIGLDARGGPGWVRWLKPEDGEIVLNAGTDAEKKVPLQQGFAFPSTTGAPMYLVDIHRGDLLRFNQDNRSLLERADAEIYARMLKNADVKAATNAEQAEWWQAAMPYAVVAIFVITAISMALLYIVAKAYGVF